MIGILPDYGSLQGNQKVIVIGSEMDTSNMCCEFNGVIQKTLSSNKTSVTCITPPAIQTQIVDIRVIMCDAFRPYADALKVENFLKYEYVTGEVVRSFSPLLGFSFGGTVITIKGYSFSQSSRYYCQFNFNNDTIDVVARYINARMLSCTTPAVANGGEAVFNIYADTIGKNLLQGQYSFLDVPKFSSSEPTIGSEFGGSNVVLFSTNLTRFTSVSCMFGSLKSSEAYIVNYYDTNSSAIVCKSPASAPLTSDIYISPNEVDYIPVHHQFEFVIAPSLFSVSPSIVTNLSSSVVVSGLNLDASSNMCCGFGSEYTNATVVNSNELKCQLPKSWSSNLNGFSTFISISVNCIDFIESSLTITKLVAPKFLKASPLIGFHEGGTIVFITGYDSTENSKFNVFCKFGSITLMADAVGNNFITCRSPAMLSNTTSVPLSVSVDGGTTYFETADKNFVYFKEPVINGLYPRLAIQGQNFKLVFLVDNISKSVTEKTLVCRIGTFTKPATIYNNSLVSCVIDNSLSAGIYSAGISLNGQEFIMAETSINIITPLRPQSISSHTIFGLPKVQNITITVTSNYEILSMLASGITCTLSSNFYKATYVSHGDNMINIICSFDQVPIGVHDLNIRLLSTGQFLLAESETFIVLDAPVFKSINPSLVSLSSPAKISIEGIFNGSENYLCRFWTIGDYSFDIKSKPIVAEDSLIVCDVNPNDIPMGLFIARHIMVGVSVDESDAYLSGFTVMSSISIAAFGPSIVLDGKVNEISINGKNFRQAPNAACRVGTQMFPLKVSNQESAVCIINVDVAGVYSLSLTFDGKEFVECPAPITVAPTPNNVRFSDTILSCPSVGAKEGAIVLAEGFTVLPTANYYCQLGYSNFVPTQVRDNMVICPCPPINFISNFLASDLVVPFKFMVNGSVDPLLSSNIQYYSVPKTTLNSNGLVVIDTPTEVVLKLDEKYDIKTNPTTCRISPSQNNTAVVTESFTRQDGTLVCVVTCSTSSILLLQLSIGNKFFYDVAELNCIPSPSVEEIFPSFGFEDKNNSVSAIVPYISGVDNIKCIFGASSVGDASFHLLYKGQEKYFNIKCRVPSLSVGKYMFNVKMGGVISSSIEYNVIPRLPT